MRVGKIEAAEEIQLLLPENMPEPERVSRSGLFVGMFCLLVALSGASIARLRRSH